MKSFVPSLGTFTHRLLTQPGTCHPVIISPLARVVMLVTTSVTLFGLAMPVSELEYLTQVKYVLTNHAQ